jgi:hypothetical protein
MGMEVVRDCLDSSISMDVFLEALELGMKTPFDWWLQHPRQHAALVELGRLEDAFPGVAFPIAMLIDRAEPKGTMTAARAIKGYRRGLLGAQRARQS